METVLFALRHIPPLMVYCTTPGLLEKDLAVKRVNACAVLAALRDPLDTSTFADALTKYAKVSAKSDLKVLLNKTLHACHDAVRRRPRVAYDPTDTAWTNAVPPTEWSIILEMFGHRLDDTATTPMILHVPITSNSLKKCLRDAPWTMHRAPPVAILSFTKLPAHTIEFVDYTLDMTMCDAEYQLRVVICRSGAVMAFKGRDHGWVTWSSSGDEHPLLDINNLITKDAIMVIYTRSLT